jgi:hypothetical protein
MCNRVWTPSSNFVNYWIFKSEHDWHELCNALVAWIPRQAFQGFTSWGSFLELWYNASSEEDCLQGGGGGGVTLLWEPKATWVWDSLLQLHVLKVFMAKKKTMRAYHRLHNSILYVYGFWIPIVNNLAYDTHRMGAIKTHCS